MTPIQMDGANPETAGALSPEDAFLARLLPEQEEDASKKKPSAEGEQVEDDKSSQESETNETDEQSETSDESPEDQGEDEGSETDKTKEKKHVDDDEAYVKVKVGEEEREVPVKELKRLWGQEASLTRKSQEVAAERTKVQEEGQKHAAALNVLLERAKAKAEPYRNIDWMGLAKNPDISAEEASALRAEAQRAFEEEKFLGEELGTFVQALTQEQTKAIATQAKECNKALSTPGTDDKPNPHYIEGWNEKVYDELRSFGVDMGLDKTLVNNLVDPAAFKLMHMAFQFHRGSSKVQTEKVNKAPKKIVKTTSSPSATRVPVEQKKKTEAMNAQRANGNLENTTNAFLARLQPPTRDE